MSLTSYREKIAMVPEEENNLTYESEPEILLAIATALHLEQNFAEGKQSITFNKESKEPSMWGYTGKLQRLSSRKNIHIRSRK